MTNGGMQAGWKHSGRLLVDESLTVPRMSGSLAAFADMPGIPRSPPQRQPSQRAGWGFLHRFRMSPETTHGAALQGDRRTARRLRRLGRGWTVFHDLAIRLPRRLRPPGHRSAWGLPDRLQALLRPAHLTPEGHLWYGYQPLTGVLATVRWEATVLTQALGTTVTPMLCVHGAQLPWGELMAEGIPVLTAGRVLTTLRALPPLLDEVQVALLTEQVRRQP